MGMQCPPKPGPGVNFINPNGLVAAASITSQTSTLRRSHIIANSLTSPMLIIRNVFSSSFAISAASAELTACTVLIAPSYQVEATSPQASVIPPTTLGVLIVVKSSRPGSTRSGENARNQSSPMLSPQSVPSFGNRTSRVVPGYVVDSSTTTMPL